MTSEVAKRFFEVFISMLLFCEPYIYSPFLGVCVENLMTFKVNGIGSLGTAHGNAG